MWRDRQNNMSDLLESREMLFARRVALNRQNAGRAQNRQNLLLKKLPKFSLCADDQYGVSVFAHCL